ncbi:MAG: protease inhibitor I42 family protein [Gaiellaceae bacterium]
MSALLLVGGAIRRPHRHDRPEGRRTTVTLTRAKLRVTLRGNPSTGYIGKVLSVDRSILKPGAWSYKPGGGAPGAGGLETRGFSALKPGTTRLKLGQVQAGSKRVAKTFLVIVAVG